MEEINELRLFWIKSPEERLKLWRDFRKGYNFTNTESLVKDVWDFWFYSPDVSKILDPYDVKNWPTVWEIIQYGSTCKYSKSLAAGYMLYFMNYYDNNDIIIARVYDKINNDIYIASIINEEYIFLPYSNEVLNWIHEKQNIIIQESWGIEQVINMVNNRTD
ncbi:MAG: hypothetical protein ACOCT9_02015 [archaeon]